MSRRDQGGAWAWEWIGGILLVVLLAGVFLRPIRHSDSFERPISVKCAHNLVLLLAEQAAAAAHWPEYSGPAFVLSLVVTHDIDPHRRDNLRTLWPDGQLPQGLDLSRYDELTPEVLRHGDLRGLTGAAGRRNLDPRYRLSGANPDPSEPIVGWRYDKGVVLGLTDGSARICERPYLGLAEDDPIVFGEASKSDLLRALSEE